MDKITQEPKIYYCEGVKAFCLTDFCTVGEEMLGYPEVSREMYDDPTYTGYGKRFVPGEITTHIRFKDGTEKYIDGKIGFFKGCGDQ